MLNFEVFDKEIQLTESELKDFAQTEFFTDLHTHLCGCYKVKLNTHRSTKNQQRA